MDPFNSMMIEENHKKAGKTLFNKDCAYCKDRNM